ncbi:MAG: imidazoleglycerol-phosphate dehydratase HisB [Firmicutes bacterium]|jgi:imidazoleglycerol-phosphate dehydratase|nr:imidazoleglycerol-phosphate dehydratase HisB [Bacillota bacterium]
MRIGEVSRTTLETEIKVKWNLDGKGQSKVKTGIGFFDHMLTAFAKHGFFDLEICAKGDLEVDAHHTVEDVGIVLGQALNQALGNKAGIARFGTAFLPMDEVLVMASIDISGRPYACFAWNLTDEQLGAFPAVLAEEFFRALAFNGGITLHIQEVAGGNMHHLLEAAFKATARALAQACSSDPRVEGLLSTKGRLG